MFTKRYYFTFVKGKGKAAVTLYLYRSKGKFSITHSLHTQYLLPWFQAYWYWILFQLPEWLKKKGNMFNYLFTTGTVHLKKMESYMLN